MQLGKLILSLVNHFTIFNIYHVWTLLDFFYLTLYSRKLQCTTDIFFIQMYLNTAIHNLEKISCIIPEQFLPSLQKCNWQCPKCHHISQLELLDIKFHIRDWHINCLFHSSLLPSNVHILHNQRHILQMTSRP